MQSALTVGDEVMLTSGVFGTLVELLEDRVSIEIAPGVVIHVARGAVGTVVQREEVLGDPEPEES